MVQTNNFLRLRFRIILYFEDNTSKTTYTGRKGRLPYILRRTKWQQAHLTVFYLLNGKIIANNQGIYKTNKDFLEALKTFTEPELLEELK